MTQVEAKLNYFDAFSVNRLRHSPLVELIMIIQTPDTNRFNGIVLVFALKKVELFRAFV